MENRKQYEGETNFGDREPVEAAKKFTGSAAFEQSLCLEAIPKKVHSNLSCIATLPISVNGSELEPTWNNCSPFEGVGQMSSPRI